MEEEIERAIDFVLSNHAKYADIRLERGYATVIDLRDDVLREMSYGIDQGMGVRVLYKDSWGFSSSNDIARSAIRTTFEDALKIGRALSLSESAKNAASVTVADAASRNDHFKLKPKINPEDVSIEEKKRMVKDAYDAAKEYSDLIKSISVVYLDGYEEQIYANSDGSYIVTETPAVFMRAGVVAKKGNVLQEGRESIGAVAGFEFIKGEDPTTLAVKAADKAVRLLDAELPPGGELPVIMDHRLTGVFMHEALGHAAEADHVLYGESILKGKLDAEIAYEGLTVADDPTIEASHGYYRYDDEGMRSSRTEIIKDGVLVSYLHSRETAGRLDAEPTANARAADYSDLPIVRMSNTVIEEGDWQFDEMRAGIKFGIYAKGMRGGQVDTVKGEFQFSAEEAFLIENGTLTKRLKNVSLSGRTLDVLKSIDAVGNDKKRGTIGFCGKDGQDVPVSEYAPHVRVKKILVGGAASA
ncbi:MAG TPA: TldD/PmbA family protein [Desulfobacteria bacterium]|nr:TldD/PmbA family protein [Desulfobacteria bacterium]